MDAIQKASRSTLPSDTDSNQQQPEVLLPWLVVLGIKLYVIIMCNSSLHLYYFCAAAFFTFKHVPQMQFLQPETKKYKILTTVFRDHVSTTVH